ncbi:Rho protein GDP-dissociation inhibitor [Dillenia turbinata]|uniref:Rho protein GDP-dissociation inhibitor n=1 Tax=Dillenia turbinata TaxID=194707 RepID=A0AAN8VPQ7_9MAGN
MLRSKGMLGSFAPQKEPYVHTLEEKTIPSGVLARGTYSAKLKVKFSNKSVNISQSKGQEQKIHKSSSTSKESPSLKQSTSNLKVEEW